MKSSFRERLRQRFGQSIFDEALRDYRSGKLDRVHGRQIAATLISLAVIAVPPVFVAAGVAMVVVFWPGVIGIVLGAILIAAGGFLLPRRARLSEDAKTRKDMPATFDMLDAISSAIGAPKIHALILTPEINAFATEIRGKPVLGFGGLLWAISTREQRIGILAHEIGHIVNGDPLRYGLTGKAAGVLGRWHSLVEPSGYEELSSEIVQVPLTLLIEGIEGLLVRLTYPESQRAEYLADAFSLEVTGRDAAITALETVELSPLAERRMNRFHGDATPGGQDYLTAVAEAVRDPKDDERSKLLAAMRGATHCVDSTHPPTMFRLQFLEAIADKSGSRGEITVDWDQVETEWAPYQTEIGDMFRKRAIVQ